MREWEQKCCANCKHGYKSESTKGEPLMMFCDKKGHETVVYICCDCWEIKDDKRIETLREWAVKKAAMYDRKYNATNDGRAWENAQRYALVVELCDKVMGENA